MARPVLLGCEGISKAFGARPLFSGVSFGLAAGDHVGMVGPNGAGKSTLLKILAGLESPDDGSVARRKGVRVGYVPQDPVFAPGESVEQVVAAALAGEERLEEHEKHHRVALALGRSGFVDRAARTETLSGGWRKRLAVARELAREPDVLLLDEPTSALDPISTAKVEELVNELKVDYSIAIVTHNMQQAARISDYTAYMYIGELVEFGETNKLFIKPTKKATEDYITGRFG